MKKLFSKKAFTLVEVLIATAITGLLIAAVMALFGPVRNLIKDIEGDVNINNTTDTIQNYLHARLDKSVGYNIDIYDAASEAMNYNEAASIGHRVGTMVNNTDLSIHTYCILLKYVDGGYRIYDMGDLSNGSAFDTKYANLENYRLFNDEYYNNANYRFTFETLNKAETAEWWCSFGITPYDENGVLLLETRKHVFRMVNNLSTPQSSDKLVTEAGYFDEENNKTPTIAIIYNIKDYLDLDYAPEAEE